MSIPFLDRALWMILGRRRTSRQVPGFRAHAISYADRNCRFGPYTRLCKHAFLVNSRVGLASYVAGGIYNTTIGKYCSIASRRIGGTFSHPTGMLSTHPAFYTPRGQTNLRFAQRVLFDESDPTTVVGSDVWIGLDSVVMSGCTIGDGAIVGACALVTKDVEPYAIVGGVPARIIRHRFSPEVIAALLEWKWWDLPIEVLRNLAPRFAESGDWSQARIRELMSQSGKPPGNSNPTPGARVCVDAPQRK